MCNPKNARAAQPKFETLGDEGETGNAAVFKIVDDGASANSEINVSMLDALARECAQRMLMNALEAETQKFNKCQKNVWKSNSALVVKKGYSPERAVTVGGGTIKIRTHRVRNTRSFD